MKTTKLFLFSMLFVTLLCVQPIQLFGQNNFNKIYNDITDLEQEIKKLKENCTKLENKVNDLKKHLENLENSLNKNNTAQQQSSQEAKNEEESNNQTQILSNVNDLLKKPYSDIQIETINDYLDLLKTVNKKEANKACTDLTQLQKEVKFYQEAVDALNKPYNQKTINRLLNNFNILKKNKAGDLDYQLKYYGDFNEVFIEIISDYKVFFNKFKKIKDFESYRNIYGPWYRDKISKDLEDINSIPYLKTKWDEYQQELSKYINQNKVDLNQALKMTDKFLNDFNNKK